VIEVDDLLGRVDIVSSRITDIVSDAALVDHVRGRGLLLGIVLTDTASADLEIAARRHGLIVNAVAPDVIRVAPPLVISDADLDDVAARWSAAIGDLR
ncbi:MAG: aminotransferase class III-fold pyridoxal phosphate-dependent enzyme, partial [Candidatus Nanopelagicales bacterium]